ncbi:hypothetical protein D3C87_1705800 [compost metagenome]
MHIGGAGRGDHGLGGHVVAEARDVLGNRAFEQVHLLREITDNAADLGRIVMREECAIEAEGA